MKELKLKILGIFNSVSSGSFRVNASDISGYLFYSRSDIRNAIFELCDEKSIVLEGGYYTFNYNKNKLIDCTFDIRRIESN